MNCFCSDRMGIAFALVVSGLAACGGGSDGAGGEDRTPNTPQSIPATSTSSLIRWEAPATMADGAVVVGLTGFKIYASRSRYDFAPKLLMTLRDATAKSAALPELTSGTWYFWITATAAVSESELQYISSVVVQ